MSGLTTIYGRKYDLSKLKGKHPGGDLILQHAADADMTSVFHGYHPKSMWPMMKQYEVEGESERHAADFDIAVEITKHAYDPGAYHSTYIWLTMLFGAMLLMAFDGYIKVAAVLLGLFWQQIAFVGHDLGHNAVTGNRKKDEAMGLIVTALFGVTGAWWRRNHNVHHVVTNSVEHDPDIQHLPVLAISPKMLKGFTSTYYNKWFGRDWWTDLLIPYQKYLFFPVMAVARYNMYMQSILDLRNHDHRVREQNRTALMVYWAWYLTMCYFLGWSAIPFTLISHAVTGIIHIQITLSHFASPIVEGNPNKGPGDYIRNQFNTNLDIECPPWMDWFHGGLQFQLEHHLMPRVPKHHLRDLVPYVENLASTYGYKRRAVPFWTAIGMMMKELDGTSRWIIGELLNCEG